MSNAALKLEDREPTPFPLSAQEEAEIRRELDISRRVFAGDRNAEFAAWKAGTHPLHPNQSGSPL